ncbi:MAG: cupin domain-containing protein [Verrucomicrobiota bacterium]|nr:cupin domain-containing protein [Verrucomicrobiota bacterium]
MEAPQLRIIDGATTRCTPQWYMPKNAMTDVWRLYFVLKGEGEFFINDKLIPLKEGHVYLLPGWQLHRHQCARSMRVSWLHIQPHSLFSVVLFQQLSNTFQVGGRFILLSKISMLTLTQQRNGVCTLSYSMSLQYP